VYFADERTSKFAAAQELGRACLRVHVGLTWFLVAEAWAISR
jgi:hypothetical protein